MIYNTMKHDIRNRVNLSMLDYCILEMIYHLSNSGTERYSKWCNAPKCKFLHLSSARTIVNRFNHLEDKGWIEFKCEKRLLKRTTKKYYNEVFCYISGAKKLHSAKVAPMQELHPKGEKVAPKTMQELHPKGEKVAPNSNIDNNKDSNIDKEERIKNLEKELFELKNQDAKKKEKSFAKKEKDTHVFPNNNSRKSYKIQKDEQKKDPRDRRTNIQNTFSSDKLEAIATLEAIYPKDNYQLLIDCQQANNGLHPTAKEFDLCRESYVMAGLPQYSYLTVISDINLFQEQFIKWIPKHLKFLKKGKKYSSKKSNNERDPNKKNGINVNYSKDKSAEMAEKYG